MVFVYDYHPASETLLNKHFATSELNGYTDPFSSDPNAPRPYSHTKNTLLRQQHSSMLPESVIWSYIIQLTAAFRVIHAAGIINTVLFSFRKNVDILLHYPMFYFIFMGVYAFDILIKYFKLLKCSCITNCGCRIAYVPNIDFVLYICFACSV